MLLSPCTSKPKTFNRKGRRERKELRSANVEVRMSNYECRSMNVEYRIKKVPL